MIPRLLLAALLLAHAAIHASFLSARPPATAGGPAWPFELGRSALLSGLNPDPAVLRLVGIALVAGTVAGFALAALAALAVVPAAVWAAGVALGCVASLALLVLFFHPWLILGIVIDVVLLWAVVASSWVPDGIGTPS